jgi:TolA-binding protein
MSQKAAAEDLLVLARRERLDDGDERRLELSLNASRELSLLYEAGVGFDAEASLLPGDEARTAQLVERTLRELDRQTRSDGTVPPKAVGSSRLRGPRSGARYFALSVACGALLTVTVASAWQYARGRWFAPQSTTLAQPGGPQPVLSAPAAAKPPTLPDVAAPSLAIERSPASSPPPALASASPNPLAAPSTKPLLSARELFTRGSVARRGGDVEAAIQLYEELCASYPGSVEAEDARLVLGNLRLEQRSPRAALNQFESYGSGALSLEALWGKAQALRRLQSPEERAVLEQLLRDYPASPYVAAAKKRLEQLAP